MIKKKMNIKGAFSLIVVLIITVLIAAMIGQHSVKKDIHPPLTPVSCQPKKGSDMPSFGEIQLVVLTFKDGRKVEHMVLATDAEKLVEASKELFYKPGIEPYSGKAKLANIAIGEPGKIEPLWWTTKNLQRDTPGIVLYDFTKFHTVWMTPRQS